MSIGNLLPVQFYELVFVLAFLLLPVVAFRGEIENYIFGVFLLYLCTKIIRRKGNKELPAEGRAVFISGCDSGFGNLEAAKLHELGYKVFAGFRNPDGESAQKLKSESSDRLHVLQLDVTSDESVKYAGKFVRDNLGECYLWALIHSEEAQGLGDMELCHVDTYEQLMKVNCFGTIRLTHELIPLIRKAKGRVIIVSNIMARFSWPSSSAYSASKMALKCVGDCLRMEMTKFDVKVCTVEPGMFIENTALQEGKDVSAYLKDVDALWDSLSDDVKSTYSKTYIRDQMTAIVKFRHRFGAKDPEAVIKALTEAVTGSNPKNRYSVHGGPFEIDPIVIYAAVHNFLPESISDWLLCKATGHGDARLLGGFDAIQNGHEGSKNE